MPHVKRRPSQRRSSALRKRHKKRKIIGILIVLAIFASIIISIVFISL